MSTELIFEVQVNKWLTGDGVLLTFAPGKFTPQKSENVPPGIFIFKSPDHRWVAEYGARRGDFSWPCLIRKDGQDYLTVRDVCGGVIFSPDSSYLSYGGCLRGGEWKLGIVELESGKQRIFSGAFREPTSFATAEETMPGMPVIIGWANANQTAYVLSLTRQFDTHGLYQLNLSHVEPDDPQVLPPALPILSGDQMLVGPVVSPDGSAIAYGTSELSHDGEMYEHQSANVVRIYITSTGASQKLFEADATEQIEIFNWSKNSQVLYFVLSNQRDGSYFRRLYKVSIENQEISQLTTFPKMDDNVRLSWMQECGDTLFYTMYEKHMGSLYGLSLNDPESHTGMLTSGERIHWVSR